ncbi:hypothetical protein PanWU01x14_350980 [Parasponia andersonii]|uniref:Uncharacterized protein n=1 Tax=Parasponia andersonii TaxID=3476 RepID=A0A2P5AAT8_PARAD|nr:hypothetical protein PanWU01x14_350980 [Parasponia andersonii]
MFDHGGKPIYRFEISLIKFQATCIRGSKRTGAWSSSQRERSKVVNDKDEVLVVSPANLFDLRIFGASEVVEVGLKGPPSPKFLTICIPPRRLGVGRVCRVCPLLLGDFQGVFWEFTRCSGKDGVSWMVGPVAHVGNQWMVAAASNREATP